MKREKRKKVFDFIQQTNKRIITIDNFFEHTYGVFKLCKEPRRRPDFISDSWSSYYYLSEKQIIRKSSHWSNFLATCEKRDKEMGCGNIASCYWEIRVPNLDIIEKLEYKEKICGKINICDFKNTFPKMRARNYLRKIYKQSSLD